ncbi:hypothetical protein QYM36_012116 [Artemia franciscana]|uniref:Uncharacterized protein n=1 Tax=Artemia franciscana TaxID=6661 RepID=A0AA88HS18_ARTSF|nr:hypothetical protein QYM36_012116 [Artemia franciscana]
MTAREVDEKTLNLFWELKAEDKKKQKACINKLSGIIRGLLQNKKEKEVPDKAKYCINRLFKGLAAGSDSSRHGFYECLKTVVNSKHLLPVKYFQDAAKDQLHTTGVMTKNEVTDFKRGQILANRLIAESEKTGEEAVGSLVAEIAVVGSKKHTLASEAAKAVLAVFDKISASTFENEVWPSLQPLVCVPMEKQSATRFEIMFKCQERFPTLISLKVLRYTVGCSQLLGPETYPFLIKFLLNCDSPTFADSLYSRLEATDKLPEFIVAIKESLGNPGKADDEGLRSFILSVIRKGHPSILSEILCSSSLLELLTKKTKTNEKHLEKITSVVRGKIADSGEDIQWAVSKSLIKAAKEMRIGAQENPITIIEPLYPTRDIVNLEYSEKSELEPVSIAIPEVLAEVVKVNKTQASSNLPSIGSALFESLQTPDHSRCITCDIPTEEDRPSNTVLVKDDITVCVLQ